MPFYTSRGLKLRLDKDAILVMARECDVTLDLDDAYDDVELWANLPQAAASVTAIVAAVVTRSPYWTVVIAFAAFALASVFQQLTYSDLLRVLLPQFLGSWLLTLPAAIACGAYLYWKGSMAASVAQLAVVLLSITGLADLFLFLTIPLRVLLVRIGVAPSIGDVELAFMHILDRQASKKGALLRWDIYDRELNN